MNSIVDNSKDTILKLDLISNIDILKEYLIKDEKLIFTYIGNLFAKNLNIFLTDLQNKKETLMQIANEIISKEDEIKNNLKEFDNSKNYIDKKNIQILKRLNKSHNLFHRLFEEDNIPFLQKKRISEEEILIELDNHLNKVKSRYERLNKYENYETIIEDNNYTYNNQEFMNNIPENIVIKSYYFRKKFHQKKFFENEISDKEIQKNLDSILKLISKDEIEEYYIENFWDMINKKVLYEETLTKYFGKIEHFIYPDLKDKISQNYTNIKIIFISFKEKDFSVIKNKIFELIYLFYYYIIEKGNNNELILKCCLRKKYKKLEENLIDFIKKTNILRRIEIKAYSNKVDLFYKIPLNYKILGTNISKKFISQINKAKHSLNILYSLTTKSKNF
jgi:hypothetical protein